MSASAAVGVGQPVGAKGAEVEPLPDVRGANACRCKIRSPEGVTRSFQLSTYSVEPSECRFARNLLSKDRCRSALFNEPEPVGPEMSFIGYSLSFARDGVRLAWAGARPDLAIVWPACQPERPAPDADPGKKVRLSEAGDVLDTEVDDAPALDNAVGDVAGANEALCPVAGVRIDLVVERIHAASENFP